MPSPRFALLLAQKLDPEFHALIASCLLVHEGRNYLFGSRVEHLGNFVEFHIIEDGKPDWPVQIPVGYVLAIADMSKPQAGPGFLSDIR